MSHKTRIEKLEQQTGTAKKHVCIIYPGTETDGYNVSDMTGGNPQHFATRADLDAFGARPDVDLLIVNIVYASEQEK